MKIATFNVEFLFDEGEHKHSGKTWFYSPEYVAERVDHLAKFISDIDADILFLQEVASASMIEKIIKKTGKNYSYFLATPDNRNVGNAVIYKSTEQDCKIESIPAVTDFPVMVEGDTDSIGPKLHSRRAFVHLTTVYNGKSLHLFGLHLNSRFFIHLQSKKDRTPLPTETQMGDFNSIERDTPLRIIQGEFETHDDALVSPARKVAPEKRYSFVGKNGKKLIDYILITRNLEPSVKSFKIMNDGLS